MKRDVHVFWGIASAALYWMRETHLAGRKPDIWEVLLAGLGGYGGARFPDVIEPATNPNHRAFFHSLTVGAGSTLSLGKPDMWLLDIENPHVRALTTGFLVGHISHLLLDASTPKGLPVV